MKQKIDSKIVKVCRKILQCIYRLSKRKVDLLVTKVKTGAGSSMTVRDIREYHDPKNKMTKQCESMSEHTADFRETTGI